MMVYVLLQCQGFETSDFTGDIDGEYQQIMDCNSLLLEVEDETITTHNMIRDRYQTRFPELSSLVPQPLDYASVVKRINNTEDLAGVDLTDILPPRTILAVSVAASLTNSRPLPEEVLETTIAACVCLIALDSAKEKLLQFLESKMGQISPNLSAVVGSPVAAKLIGAAGGLEALANMPACNVQLLGARRNNLEGFSSATTQNRVGYLEQTKIVQITPPCYTNRACRVLASKSTLAARLDFSGGDPSGNTGRKLREEIRSKIDKWQVLPPAKRIQALPVPRFETKRRRGGRRLRKMKERYAVTEMRKLAYRMQFGVPEETSLGDGLGFGYGMLGQAGCGKLRVTVAQSSLAAKLRA
ncbi:U4/U6-U5 snRNP complex subunit prp31 [Turnera subulata]|uniref:U4/U6-U5 snRNP complex subunit prp31 n=1 Tax=Turnera subulata TaxID=218843 RepID=A0A9Q0FIC1_9ROSI|nr:U4/U6-U5 snRNP complex subunit prp31 [Turnera subulata]